MNELAEFYRGSVFHARFQPRRHHFRYPVFFMRLNIRTLDAMQSSSWFGVDTWRPLSFFQRDHGLRDGSPILAWAEKLLENAGVADPGGKLWLYTFPRLWGFAFKPVSFWHWHDVDGHLRVLLAEVNNTFGERHIYLLQEANGGPITCDTRLTCRKLFHVSPFCAVNGHYHFACHEADASYRMVIDHGDSSGDILHTSLAGTSLAFSGANALKLLCTHPVMTFGVVFRIHWQALRLWLKGVPFFRKPSPPTAEVSS